MPTITCQYTAIEFSAASARSKNHPRVSRLLQDAAGDKHHTNRYRLTLEALAEVRQANLNDIDEIIRRVEYIVSNRLDGQHTAQREEAARQRQAEQERAAAKQARKERNAFLRSHGYIWSKNENYDFDNYEEPDGSFVWELWSPDRREVTVAQALDEIERGAGLGEIAQREAAQAEAKAQADATKQAELNAFDAERDDAIAGMAEVVRLPLHRDTMTVVARQVLSYRTTIVLRGEVNGIAVAAVERYTYDHDSYSYFCADALAAGLTPVAKPEPGSLEETFSFFFGE